MIEFGKNNFFDAGTEGMVCTVNTVGIMGKGIALEFKKRFPDNFSAYQKWCHSGAKPGTVFLFKRNNNFIFNFATKEHWRNPSKIEWIVSGLKELKKLIIENNVKSIAVPALGCSLGGLNWNDVKPLIISELTGIDCNVMIFEPNVR